MKKQRYIPFGYTIRDGEMVIDRGEAKIIRDIFDTYINGASLKAIAQRLTALGVPYTEKTNVWDKARIARIIDNARYIGAGEYDPIIDEGTFETAAKVKVARQRNNVERECVAIELIRDRVRCGKCGAPMVRRISNKARIRESWTCDSPTCGFRMRISDTELLTKITLLMNRIIENNDLMIPCPKERREDSSIVREYQREIEQEMTRERPSEDFIIARVGDIASQLFRETQAKANIAARIARKRVMLMSVQDTFNCGYFSDLVETISIGEGGKVKLHTKTKTEITEGEDYGSP